MSRPRKFGHDYVYGLDHFERFPEQYRRLEHRFSMADIDWCEFCGYARCRKVVGLFEMFRDRPDGIDLSDKATTVIRHLARGVNAPAYVVAYLTERPADVQAEIDKLNARVLELTRRWPITRFRARLIEPRFGPAIAYTAEQWWELVAALHSEHHLECEMARRSRETLANPSWLLNAQSRHGRAGLWAPSQPVLFGANGEQVTS